MDSDRELKARWEAAHQRGLRGPKMDSDGLSVPESPLSSRLDIRVNSKIDVATLRQRVLALEEKEPGFILSSYKGCCNLSCKSGFPKEYKALLERLMGEGKARAIKRQVRQDNLEREALSHPMIQKAREVFDVERIEVCREVKRRGGGFRSYSGRVDRISGD